MSRIGKSAAWVEQIAEPDRENYAVLRISHCWIEGKVANRLAQNVSRTGEKN